MHTIYPPALSPLSDRAYLLTPPPDRNVLVSGAVVFGCYFVYASVVLAPLVKSLDDHEEKAASSSGRGEMVEAEPLFIALPFTTKSITPPPYSGSGPEWQEFVKISADPKMQGKIRCTATHSY